jgi:hypothetical protein
MGFLERVNRILVSGLILLVFIQMGLLFFLKSLKDEAQNRLVKNTSKVELVCGEKQFADEKYWSFDNENLIESTRCSLSGSCNSNRLRWKQENQAKELHLIAITSPPAFNRETLESGGVVRVRVKKSAKPQIIALVSRMPLEWNFEVEKGAQIEKVIVATPTTVWLQGLDSKTALEYLPKEKMCSYPYAWEEALNPENEFRVVVSALQKVTQLSLNSFQGAQTGKEFLIPSSSDKGNSVVSVRGLASVAPTAVAPEPVLPTPTALKWKRSHGLVIADVFKMSSGELVKLPEKTTQAIEAQGNLYAVIKGRLHLWDLSQQTFHLQTSPLNLPDVNWIAAMAYDSKGERLVIYNDSRSGEFYYFQLSDKKWTLFKDGFNYNVASLFYDVETNTIKVLTSRGGFFTALASIGEDGRVSYHELKEKLPFDRQRWRWNLENDRGNWQVNIYSPLMLNGQAYALD